MFRYISRYIKRIDVHGVGVELREVPDEQTSASKPGDERLYGTWVGRNSDGQSLTMVFGRSKRFSLQVDAETGEGVYWVDWTKSPVYLDIDLGKLGKISTIIEIARDNMKLENNEPGRDRPLDFTSEAVIFVRSKAR